ncbi:MAG: hypothetical protein ABT940_09790 [Alphaproteobacteria bacterium]
MHFHSTHESVEKGEPTVLAILETIFAVIGYWTVAWYFDTHIHLLVSICVAPFLLLRSPESVKEGAEWFYAYLTDETEITRTGTPWRFWGVVLAGFATSATVAYFLSTSLLQGHAGWSLFWHVFLLGMLAVAVAGVAAVAVAGVVLRVAGAVVARVGMTAGVTAITIVPAVFGLWLRSLWVRILATILHLKAGFLALPGNWHHALVVIDFMHPPELVPGLESQVPGFESQAAVLSLRFHVNRVRGKEKTLSKFLSAIAIPIFFAPALFYRLSLKSTFWLYYPLIYLTSGGKPPAEWTWEDVDKLYGGRLEWLRRGLGFMVLTSTVVSSFQLLEALRLTREYHSAPMLMYLFAFDLRHLAPWHWFALTAAAITFIVIFLSDDAYRPFRMGYRTDPPGERRVLWLAWLTRLRNVATVMGLLLAVGYVVVAMVPIDLAHLPGGLSFLVWLYGPYLPGTAP